MAVLKIENGEQYTLAGMLNYINDKPEHDGEILYFDTVYCSRVDPLRDMMLIKMLWNQTNGKQYRQLMLSLTEEESSEGYYEKFIFVASLIAQLMAKIFGSQIAFAVHVNTNNLHAHFVINTVRFMDGYRIRMTRCKFSELKAMIDEVLADYRFSPLL